MEQIECSTILWNKIKKFAYTDQAAGVTDRPEVVEDAAKEKMSVYWDALKNGIVNIGVKGSFPSLLL